MNTTNISCTRCQSPIEPEDLRCAVCSLPTQANLLSAPDRAMAQILRCEECGAAVCYNVEVQAPRCSFCRSVMHLEQPVDPIEEASAYLPFGVQPAAATQAVQYWLGTLGFFRPSDLQRSATLHTLQPLWWVGWVFDADTLVSWTADSDLGSGRSPWAPHSGQHPLTLRSILVSASRGLTSGECAQLTPFFKLQSAKAQPQGPAQATIERFDVQRSAARQTIVAAVEGAAAQHARGWIPGSRYRNLNLSVLLRKLFTRRYAFPTYVLAYRYRDRVYRAIVHGQDARCVVGEAPYSIAKIAAVIGAGLLLLALIAGIIILVIVLDGGGL